ncbi:hypothetical protein [Hydrogenophaga sp.]|uniref:hypothetical protein n=1 Tax=Hydrogenophaga sp. TaxID=1904254 RepID=UPI0027179D76|nr:hypothetical protein [Hydrogenophaga sp.]MDO8903985.1 hypothetical protein [Hydrogenophaga sp.]
MLEIDRSSGRVLLRCVFCDPERAATAFTGLMARLSSPPDEPEPTVHVTPPRAPSSGPAFVEPVAEAL